MIDFIDWTAPEPELRTTLAHFLINTDEQSFKTLHQVYADSHLTRFARRHANPQLAAVYLITEVNRIATEEDTRMQATCVILGWLLATTHNDP